MSAQQRREIIKISQERIEDEGIVQQSFEAWAEYTSCKSFMQFNFRDGQEEKKETSYYAASIAVKRRNMKRKARAIKRKSTGE